MTTQLSLVHAFSALSIVTATLGCAERPSESDQDVSSVSEAVIISVNPPSEETVGPDGHILRLNRDVNGFDALPSTSNDSGGAHFTAPCGCVYLAVDDLVTYNHGYVQNDPLVRFSHVLEEGPHKYEATYGPKMDPKECVGPWACPDLSTVDTVYVSDSCFALMQPYGALDPPGILGGCCIWVSC